MSDASNTKKGIRTFAADFARLKERGSDPKAQTGTSAEETIAAEKHKQTKTTNIVVPETDHTQTEDIKQIVAKKAKTIPRAVTTTDQPKKIPSFHELQKEPARDKVVHKGSVIKKITARNKKGIQPSRQVGGGTVITATKKNTRPEHLGLLAGLIAWVASLTKKKRQAPQIAIPETSRRKGVIQTATTKTGTIFTADSETLKERIKERVRQREQAEHDPETNWSPYTETGFALLEAGDEIITTPTNVSVAFKQHAKPEPVVVEPEVVKDVPKIPEPEKPEKDEVPKEIVETDNRWDNAEEPSEPQNSTPVAPAAEQPVVPAPPTTVPTPDESTAARPSFFTRLMHSVFGSQDNRASVPSNITNPGNDPDLNPVAVEPVSEETSIIATQPVAEDVNLQNKEKEVTADTTSQKVDTTGSVSQTAVLPKSYNAKQLLQTSSTNRLTVASTLLIVGIVLIVFLGFQVSEYFGEDQQVVAATQTWLSTNQIIALTIDDSFTAQSLINTAQSGQSGVIEYSLYNTDGETLPAALALDLVSDNFPITIQQFGTEARFISIDQARPQLLMQITDPTSVTGALLAQEVALTESLVPLFGVTPAGTYMDATIGSTDVRILTSTSGQTSLTYGFINDSVFIITGSPEEFVTILERTQ